MKRHLHGLHDSIKKLFYYDPVRKNPLSLYLIDMIAKLIFHEKREIETFMSFGESNNQDWFSYNEFTRMYSIEIKEEYNNFKNKLSIDKFDLIKIIF